MPCGGSLYMTGDIKDNSEPLPPDFFSSGGLQIMNDMVSGGELQVETGICKRKMVPWMSSVRVLLRICEHRGKGHGQGA